MWNNLPNILKKSVRLYLLTLYQPMTHMCIMSSHKPIRINMGGLIVGVNTLYRLFCFFKLFPMVGKGLSVLCIILCYRGGITFCPFVL